MGRRINLRYKTSIRKKRTRKKIRRKRVHRRKTKRVRRRKTNKKGGNGCSNYNEEECKNQKKKGCKWTSKQVGRFTVKKCEQIGFAINKLIENKKKEIKNIDKKLPKYTDFIKGTLPTTIQAATGSLSDLPSAKWKNTVTNEWGQLVYI